MSALRSQHLCKYLVANNGGSGATEKETDDWSDDVSQVLKILNRKMENVEEDIDELEEDIDELEEDTDNLHDAPES